MRTSFSQHNERCPLSRNSWEGQPKSTHISPKRVGVYGHCWALVFTARTSTAWSPPLQHQDPGSHLTMRCRATQSSLASRQPDVAASRFHILVEMWWTVINHCPHSRRNGPEVRSTPATRKRYVTVSLRSPVSRGPRLVGLQWFTTTPVGRLWFSCDPNTLRRAT